MSNIDNIKNYTVIDLEMTGLSAKNDKIIEIGAARVRGGEIVDTISTLVNPKQHIPQRVQELTGITDSDVENAADMDAAVAPVREAFQILAHDGLIKLRPNKGAIVLGITETYIREHYQLRGIL